MNKILLFFILKYQCNWDNVYEALENREPVTQNEIDLVEKKIECQYVSIIDDNYPNYIKRVYKPSFIIFYYGDITIVKEKLFAFDGKIKNLTKKFLSCEEMKHFGNILINGEESSVELINFLINSGSKFAIVFDNILSKKAKKIINLLREKNCKNWVVISENYNHDLRYKSSQEDFFRMIFPTDETVVLSPLSSIKNLKEKINFWKKENIKIMNILEPNNETDKVNEKNPNIINVSKPDNIKVFVSYKN